MIKIKKSQKINILYFQRNIENTTKKVYNKTAKQKQAKESES